MAHVADYKKKIVKEISDSIKKSSIIGAINVENLPAPQLQRIRAQLRSSVKILMTKKRLIKLALEDAKKTKQGVEELEKYLEGMPALIFTQDNPFRLYRLLQKNKSPAPAKAGQKAPRDILVPKGPTSFAPGPIISELSQIGIKTGVDKGKVSVKEDSIVAKKGEIIKQKVAEVLLKLGVEPMEVGLDLVAVYENGIVYNRDILAVDETEFMNKLGNAARYSFNLAMFIEYPTKDTIRPLIGKAFNDAKALGVSQEIIDDVIIDILLGKANQEMLSLKNIAHIEVVERKITKEEKVLEEEKKIIEEEKELEKSEQKIEAPVEKEVRQAVKEEEEKQLETERIGKEKEFEKLEKAKPAKKEVSETADELEEAPKELTTAAELAAKKRKEQMEEAEKLVQQLQRKGTLR